jgi:hypothetical protein
MARPSRIVLRPKDRRSVPQRAANVARGTLQVDIPLLGCGGVIDWLSSPEMQYET